MNTNSPNKLSNTSLISQDSREGVDKVSLSRSPRISSSSSIEMPKKTEKVGRKTKKAEGAFRTISEVADLLDVQQHVLRFWETKFSQIKPLKRGGGRRYYRPEDVALLQRIHHLLYTQGYTIKGAQKLLKGQSKSQIVAGAQKEAENQNHAPMSKFDNGPVSQTSDEQRTKKGLSEGQKTALEAVLEELKALREAVD